MDLDLEVNRAAKDRPPVDEDRGQTLVPSEVTTREAPEQPATEAGVFGVSTVVKAQPEPDIDVDAVFTKPNDLKVKE
jgi:uncharacterized protein